MQILHMNAKRNLLAIFVKPVKIIVG